MQRFNQLTKVFLALCLACFLFSCSRGIPAVEAYEADFSMPSFPDPEVILTNHYFGRTKGLVDKSREIKQKMPLCADLNNSFDWNSGYNASGSFDTSDTRNSINNFIADCQTKRQSFIGVKNISDAGLTEANSIEAYGDTAELKQKYVNFFTESSNHAQRGIEYSEYLEHFCNAEIQLLDAIDYLDNASPSSVNSAIRQLRTTQNKMVAAKEHISNCYVPNDCAEYQNSFINAIDILYACFNEYIAAVNSRSISRIEQIEDEYTPKLDGADASIIAANSSFNEKAKALDEKLIDLAGEVNNELDSLCSKYNFDRQEEFFSVSPPENQT